MMSRLSTSSSNRHDKHGVVKRSTNIQPRRRIRWIQEFPETGELAAQEEEPMTGTLLNYSSRQDQDSRIYRTTPTGERRLRAPLLSAFLLADAPLRLSLGSSSDPFSTLPVPYKPPYGIITSYFKYAVAPAIVKESFEPPVGKTREQALEDIDWPVALSVQTHDPALFFASLVVFAAHFPDSHEYSPRSNPFFFQWLSSKCVEYLNKSLAVPSRAYSDGSLTAVAFIAFASSMTGSHHLSTTIHKPGLRQMVMARGGLEAVAKSSFTGARAAQLISAFDIVVASKFGEIPTFVESLRLGAQDVELKDIMPRIKREAEGQASPSSPRSPMSSPDRETLRSTDTSTANNQDPQAEEVRTVKWEFQIPLR